MPCTRCDGTCANDQFYDRVDERGQLQLGAWRWASQCPECGAMVDERGGSIVPVSSAPIDRQGSMPMFQMF